ncbi:hypothetical protein EDB83DRAFT_2417693, partial [Lactarius deliciosus]
MPGFENEPLQHSSLLAELFGTDLPGVFQLQGIESPRLTARPPGSIDLGVGNYPPGMCGSSAFDDALRSLGEDPATRTTTHYRPAQQRPIRCRGSTLTSTCRTLAGSAPPPPPAAGGSAPAGHAYPVETPSSESLACPSPMPSFYATTPSPVSAVEPSPPPPPAQYQPWMPPSGAANAAGRRVG